MKQTFPLILALAATPALAEETREMGAHVHGVGALNIAFDGSAVAMEFQAPGADIVGFEHSAATEADRAAIDAAVATLARPLDLFAFPDAAACSVTRASAGLKTNEDQNGHDDHGHDDHAEHAEKAGHDDHDAHGHDDHGKHGHDDQAEHGAHEEHAHAEGHDEHDHGAHGAEAQHTEFHAEYTLTCANPGEITEIAFDYFKRFENARALEVQIVTDSGAQAADVRRDDPMLDLSRLF